MSEVSPEERAFLDAAYELLKTARRTLSEREALHTARQEGYDLRLSFDKRFARAEGRLGNIPPHWRLAEQTLANTRLLNELLAGTWDGRNLDEKLQAMSEEDDLSYTFYPHDPRLSRNRLGIWEVAGERQVALPEAVKEALDALQDRLHECWLGRKTPLTVRQVFGLLEELGWQHETVSDVHKCLRAWLLTVPQFRRVGEDYWIPAQLLPPQVQRTRLQVLPIRAEEHVVPSAQERADALEWIQHEQAGTASRERIILKGTATQTQMEWVATLRSIHLNEGFIPVPKAVRGVYPPVMPGEEQLTVLHGLWYEDATELWIWLDRAHHRLYGPDLLDTIGFLSAGVRLRITWDATGLVLREEGHDVEVQQEETRLVDLEALRQLRGGIGEGYRQAIQALLLAEPEGLPFKEIVLRLRERQQHEVARNTVRSVLASGGFIQRQQRWYAAPDTRSGAKQLQAALLETLVPQKPEGEQVVLSPQEYRRTRILAIHRRLQAITSTLREQRQEE